MNEEPDKAVVDKNMATLTSKLDAYDVILGKQKYLAGDVRMCLVGFMQYSCSTCLIVGNHACGPIPPSAWNYVSPS
jgi:hypothetical protein